MKTVIIIALAALSATLFSQNFEYPAGVYMSYSELISKKPSKNCELNIFKRPIDKILQFGGADFEITSDTRCIKNKKIQKEVFAYSTGKELFVNNGKLFSSYGFSNVIQFGRFLLFEGGLAQSGPINTIQMGSIPYLSVNGELPKRVIDDSEDGSGAVVAGGMLGGIIGAAIGAAIAESQQSNAIVNNIRFYYVIDQRDNKIKTLNIAQMKFYMNEYPELLKQYEQEDSLHTKENYLKYIQLLNAIE